MIYIVNPQPPTPRQMQVGELWAMGRTSTQIGNYLDLSFRTAESHIAGFYQCTGCECRSDVFDWFRKNVWSNEVGNSKFDNSNSDISGAYCVRDFCHSFIDNGQWHTATIPADSYEVSIEYV